MQDVYWLIISLASENVYAASAHSRWRFAPLTFKEVIMCFLLSFTVFWSIFVQVKVLQSETVHTLNSSCTECSQIFPSLLFIGPVIMFVLQKWRVLCFPAGGCRTLASLRPVIDSTRWRHTEESLKFIFHLFPPAAPVHCRATDGGGGAPALWFAVWERTSCVCAGRRGRRGPRSTSGWQTWDPVCDGQQGQISCVFIDMIACPPAGPTTVITPAGPARLALTRLGHHSSWIKTRPARLVLNRWRSCLDHRWQRGSTNSATNMLHFL